jgi:cysteinyl-tRNA synthetase
VTIRENNLHVYNTLTRRREKFEPLSPPASADSPGEARLAARPRAAGPRVGMYVCGPTVYGDAHLGHAKSYISFDVIVRYLRYLGYDVTYVQNVTDVGHLTDDADAGEDKVEKAARAKKVHPMQIAEQFTRRYFEDMDALNVLRPDISPRASGHIVEQIEHVRKLIERGHAYEANGSVYFDVASWPKYGRLSGRSVDEMQAGARVESSAEKRHPADFALWKRAEPGHIMQWPSPWGMGYPGWHIECTVMGQKYLGETLDIHGGGIENQFPHHEDEIAQAEAASGKPFVKYWLHNNMVTVGGQKMGKSLGNFLTLRDAFEKWPPMVIRLFILQSHYRSPTDFSPEALEAARAGYERLAGAAAAIAKAATGAPDGDGDPKVAQLIQDARKRFAEAMDDDFNTPLALSALFDLARDSNRLVASGGLGKGSLEALAAALEELAGDVLGLRLKASAGGTADVGIAAAVVEIFIEMRAEARKAKDFKRADAIRDRLAEAGVLLEDTPDGTTWRIK